MFLSKKLGLNFPKEEIKTSGFVYPSSNFIGSSPANPSGFQVTKATDSSGNLLFLRITSNLADTSDLYGKLIFADENSLEPLRMGRHLVKFNLELESGTLGSAPKEGLSLDRRDSDEDPSAPNTDRTRINTVGPHQHIVTVFNDGVGPAPSLFLLARKDSKFVIKLTNIEIKHLDS
jgi:hypothetical protein